MTIGHATADIVALIGELTVTRRDRDTWREIAHAAVEHAHGLYVELTRTQAAYHRALDRERERRAQTMPRETRAA